MTLLLRDILLAVDAIREFMKPYVLQCALLTMGIRCNKERIKIKPLGLFNEGCPFQDPKLMEEIYG